MKETRFTHLHVHSEYSLLDGLIKIPDLVSKVKDHGMTGVALTDHGMMSGVLDFWTKCNEYEIKPIIGCEIYIAVRSRFDKIPKIDDKRFHLLLLAKNEEGYHNLVKINSLSHIEGFYYKPRADKELLQKYSKGLICLTSCDSNPINKAILNKQPKQVKQWIEFLKETYQDFYLEVQRNGIKQSIDLVPQIVKLSKEFRVPIVGTCDVHYINKEDWKAQEVLWAIADGKTIDDETRRKAISEEFYLKSSEEMVKLFKDLPEAITNTQEIEKKVEKYNITYTRVEPKIPPIPNNFTPHKYLEHLTYEGLKQRYNLITPEVENQVRTELEIIKDKNYTKYFLVCWDLSKFAKENDIWMGPGRGSGPSSIVAYSLGITHVEPTRWELPFERFLNPERNSPPDFDLDFEDDRRDEMFEYMHRRYGRETVVNICTFGRMKTRAAIRDVARVLGIDLEVADRLSKMVTVKFGRVTLLDDMIKENPEFKQILTSNPELLELTNYVRKIEGIVRHVSMHACAMALAPEPMYNLIPVMLETRGTGKKRIMTQIEGYPLEPMGFLKIDFLGLSNMTILKRAINLLRTTKKIEIKLDDIPFDDKRTYQLLSNAETTAIFQMESDGMKKYLRDLKPENIEDIMFLNAAYRPGPMKYIPDYIKRKHKRQEVIYPHNDTIPVLEKTYGIAIYQEQVMKIAVVMAGYSMGEADMLRRAMGKKKPEIMKVEKIKFTEGCIKKGYTKKLAEKLFSYMEPFADYGFNRSHSLCYSLIIYWSAFFKANYPVEFMAALMQTDHDTPDKVKRDLLECERMKIEVKAPNINKSEVGFTIEGENTIRYGLGAIKNVGDKCVEIIVKIRKERKQDYKSIEDLVTSIGTCNINKKTLECLIKVGALDQFGKRKALLNKMPIIVERIAKHEKRKSGGQTAMFESLHTSQDENSNLDDTYLSDEDVETEKERLEWEKELLGAYISSHPLKKYLPYYDGKEILTIKEAKKTAHNKPIKIGGMITEKREIKTKKLNKDMAFIKIEGIDEHIDGVIFTTTYEKLKDKIEPYAPIVISGRSSIRNGEFSIVVEDLENFKKYKPLFKLNSETAITLDLSYENDPSNLQELKEIIVGNPGDSTLDIFYNGHSGNKEKKMIKRKINLNPDVIKVIRKYVVKK